MTEEEAAKLWCPMVRHANAQFQYCGNSLASMPGNGRFPTCIGSRCLMWRWVPLRKATKAGPIRVGDSEHGYCGLAGKP